MHRSIIKVSVTLTIDTGCKPQSDGQEDEDAMADLQDLLEERIPTLKGYVDHTYPAAEILEVMD
jgi:hypothetical protein